MPKEPQFAVYQEMKRLADETSLAYFAKWHDIINLEQSSMNIHAFSSLMTQDTKRQIKDEGLTIAEI